VLILVKIRNMIVYGYKAWVIPYHYNTIDDVWVFSMTRREAVMYFSHKGGMYVVHRENGPAQIDGGVESWFRHGLVCNTEGPAYIWPNGTHSYYDRSGFEYTRFEPDGIQYGSNNKPNPLTLLTWKPVLEIFSRSF